MEKESSGLEVFVSPVQTDKNSPVKIGSGACHSVWGFSFNEQCLVFRVSKKEDTLLPGCGGYVYQNIYDKDEENPHLNRDPESTYSIYPAKIEKYKCLAGYRNSPYTTLLIYNTIVSFLSRRKTNIALQQPYSVEISQCHDPKAPASLLLRGLVFKYFNKEDYEKPSNAHFFRFIKEFYRATGILPVDIFSPGNLLIKDGKFLIPDIENFMDFKSKDYDGTYWKLVAKDYLDYYYQWSQPKNGRARSVTLMMKLLSITQLKGDINALSFLSPHLSLDSSTIKYSTPKDKLKIILFWVKQLNKINKMNIITEDFISWLKKTDLTQSQKDQCFETIDRYIQTDADKEFKEIIKRQNKDIASISDCSSLWCMGDTSNSTTGKTKKRIRRA